MNPLPLLHGRTDLQAALAWRQGEPISAARFIAESQWLAQQLPASGRPINLCQDRYHFALGLAAALWRGQTSLLPPNALTETLAQVPAAGPVPYLLIDDPRFDPGAMPAIRVARPRAEALDALASSAAAGVPTRLDAVCLLTSGSTGAPQPHAKRWDALTLNIAAEAERLAQLTGRADLAGMTIVATVPPQHSYGLESSVLLALLGGASFDAGRPFYPADIVQALERVPRPRALVTTPFHLKTLLLSGLTLPPVDLMLSATAPLSPQLAAQAEALLRGPLVEIYGCTEAGQVASRRTTAGPAWTTLGALTIAAERGPDGEQFVVSGGHVAEPTPLADVLELDDATHFRLLGRANDLIHVAGKRSSLAHLNFHLNRIAGVDDGAFWLPDEVADGVVRPIAFVVAPGLAPRALIRALREHLEPAFVPRRVIAVDALPREATGKLTAAALRRFALQTLARVDATDAPGQAPTRSAAPAAAAAATDPTEAAAPHEPTFTIGADHPALAGHFPGHPVLPGVVLLTLVMQALQGQPALAARLGAMPVFDSAKFLAPVTPSPSAPARLRVQLRDQGRGLAFEVWHDALLVARGQLAPGAP